MLPFGDLSLIGTTDLPFDQDPASATASQAELEYLLRAVHLVFPQVGLKPNDIEFHYSGVRPLPFVTSRTTAAITRRHHIEAHQDFPVPAYSVVGGKLTTCRSLAEEVAARVAPHLGNRPQSHSRGRPLPGSEGYPRTDEDIQRRQRDIAQQSGFSLEQVQAVWSLCGTEAEVMLSGPRPPSDNDPAENLIDTPLPLGFVRQTIRDEWVTRLEDLVERRLMLLYHQNLSHRCLTQLAELLADAGKIEPGEVSGCVAACVARLAEHFGKTVVS